MSMHQIGTGIFTWGGAERRSQRYGNFHLCNTNYNANAKAELVTDKAVAETLDGKRVRITCRVTESRPSGHAGDLFLGIMPKQPAVGAEFVLGVGTLRLGLEPAWDATVTASLGLEPDDGRKQFWFDPKVLYQLHDQTVAVFVEEAEGVPCHAAPEFKPSKKGMKANGDGTFQTCGVEPQEGMRIAPKMERLGDGLFLVSHERSRGEDMEYTTGGK